MPKHIHCNKPRVYACTRVNIIQADDGTDDDDEADMARELDDPEQWVSKYYDELKQKKSNYRAASIPVTRCMA